MKFYAIALAVSLAVATAFQAAVAVTPVTAHLTADNHYGLYTGDESGGGLSFVGRNEQSWNGAPGMYNWSVAETLAFHMEIGDYVYIAAWDNQVVGGVLGEFETYGGTVYTGSHWEVGMSTLNGFGEASALPATGDVASAIAAIESAGDWVPAYGAEDNGSLWDGVSLIPNVSSSAHWIWYGEYSSQTAGELFIFRSRLGLEETSTDETSWGAVKELFR